MRRYRLRSAYRHITGINISPPLPPFHLIQLRLNALLWRRLVPPSPRRALALRQSAPRSRRRAPRPAAGPRRRTRSRRRAAPHPTRPARASPRRCARKPPATRRGGERARPRTREPRRRETRPDPPPRGGSRNPRRDASPSRTARGGLSRSSRARARARWRLRARSRRSSSADPPLGVSGCPPTCRRRGRLPRRPRRRAAEARRRPERRSRPGGCRSGTLETKPPPPPPPPARFFVAGLRFGLLDPDRAAPPEPVDQVALDRCELVERRGARRRAHARLARLLLRRQFLARSASARGERRNGPPARAATGVAQVRQRERVFRRLTHFDRALCRKAPCR